MFSKFIINIFMFLVLCAFKHTGPKYDVKAREELDKVGLQIAKKYNMQLLGTGVGIVADAKNGTWALNLTSKQLLTIEQAKPIVADITYSLLFMMYHNPKFANYAKATQAPLKNDDISFRLAFWDENVNRPIYPYLAQIRLADGKLYFHYADPTTQTLKEPIVEPIESLGLNQFNNQGSQ